MPSGAIFALTSRAAIKSLLNIEGPSLDTEIDALILVASDKIAKYCGRDDAMETRSRTEVHDVYPGQRVWQLLAWPVASISSVRFDPNRDFAAASALSTDNYHCDTEAGLLRTDYPLHTGQVFGTGYGWLQVTYTGGVGDSLQAMRSYHASLELGCQLLIQYVQKRQALGPGSVSASVGGASRALQAMKIPDFIADLIDHFVTQRVGN